MVTQDSDGRATAVSTDTTDEMSRRVLMNAPHWIERFRSDRWHVTITLLLDLVAAAGGGCCGAGISALR